MAYTCRRTVDVIIPSFEELDQKMGWAPFVLDFGQCNDFAIVKANFWTDLEMTSRMGTCSVIQVRAYHTTLCRPVTVALFCDGQRLIQGPTAKTEAIASVSGKADELKEQLQLSDSVGVHTFLRKPAENASKKDKLSIHVSLE